MKKYFIKINEEQKGPFTLDELKEMSLTDKYLYWTEGYSSWRKITEIKELENSVLKLPPTIDPNQNKINEITQKNNQRKLLFIILGSLVIFFILGGFSDKYDLLEQHRGLAESSYGDEAAMKIRAILAIISIIISGIIAYFIYFQQMYTTYKKLYEKREL